VGGGFRGFYFLARESINHLRQHPAGAAANRRKLNGYPDIFQINWPIFSLLDVFWASSFSSSALFWSDLNQ
jgi:hypothetical protein